MVVKHKVEHCRIGMCTGSIENKRPHSAGWPAAEHRTPPQNRQTEVTVREKVTWISTSISAMRWSNRDRVVHIRCPCIVSELLHSLPLFRSSCGAKLEEYVKSHRRIHLFCIEFCSVTHIPAYLP